MAPDGYARTPNLAVLKIMIFGIPIATRTKLSTVPIPLKMREKSGPAL
jgi:hypothetical protein